VDLDPAAADAPAHPTLQDVRVLYVDSNPMQRLVVAEQFAEWKMRPDVVDSGARALDAARRAVLANDPHRLVIIDHLSTSHSATELAAVLGAGRPDAPVLVLLTDGGTRGRAAEFSAAGFGAYLSRPLRSETLADALEKLLAPRCDLPTPAAAHTPITASPEPADGPRRVLLVDDNVVNQKVGAKMLEKMGCRVDLAGNGLEAVDAWGRVPYQIIFMDCQMPEMDGYEATEEIRRREATGARTPIVALTANAMQGDRERCLEAGMDDYLSKPIKPAELQAIVAKWGRPVGTCGSHSGP